MDNKEFWKELDDVKSMLKQAFVQMPGGQPAAKQAQMEPTAVGGAAAMPPMGGDPAAAGLPPDLAAAGGAAAMPPMGGDPAAMAGLDPAMLAGAMPAAGGDPAAAAAPGSPMITISLDQLFEIIQKVLGLAKKVGVNGSGVQQPAPEQAGMTADQLKATIYEALGNTVG